MRVYWKHAIESAMLFTTINQPMDVFALNSSNYNDAPKITWAAVTFILLITFSSGTAWISIFNNKDTNDRQWIKINETTAKVERHDSIIMAYAPMIESSAESNRRLSEALIVLATETKNATIQREKDADSMSKISAEVTSIRIKVERMEERQLSKAD